MNTATTLTLSALGTAHFVTLEGPPGDVVRKSAALRGEDEPSGSCQTVRCPNRAGGKLFGVGWSSDMAPAVQPDAVRRCIESRSQDADAIAGALPAVLEGLAAFIPNATALQMDRGSGHPSTTLLYLSH